MDLAFVKEVLKLVEESSVNEIELEEEGIRVRITKSAGNVGVLQQMPQPVVPQQFPAPAAPPPPPEPAPAADKKYHEVKSPIVGTFYRAPAPDASNYVEVGQQVQEGTVLCIVEAMKLMNEIESDGTGRIAKICVENGKPVEYNQVLFLIETA
ncbi:MAG TPA: acetyl-CoA carboxylase biotin carboxyl carrier protein [Bacteroidota bacterium]|nr:acetyl-CoA carboxylase biotin carboxyl carrier protein [Bacteroidota bacterium]